MFTVKNSLKSYTFIYDFTIDGGAIGSFNSPLKLPEGCGILEASIYTIIAPLSATGIANLSFGYTTSPVNFYNKENLIEFVAGEMFNRIQKGVIKFNTVPTNQGDSLCFSITGEDLTAGKLMFSVLYLEF